VILFFAEDLAWVSTREGAKRGEEGGGFARRLRTSRNDGHERGKVGRGDTVEKAGEEASGGQLRGQSRRGQPARQTVNPCQRKIV